MNTIGNIYGDLIEKKYIKDKFPITKIAKEIGCHHKSILTILKNRNIPRRKKGDYIYKCSEETKQKISKNNGRYWKGKKHSEKTKMKISQSRKGKLKGSNNPNWRSGSSFEPYCQLFNNDFKERCRDFWGRKCGICGCTEEEQKRKMYVHHINYDKKTCCNITTPLFISLCLSCHIKTNYNRRYWENMLTDYIMIWYNEECYIKRERE